MQPTPERAPAPDPVTIHPARVGFKGGMVVWRVRRGDLWTLCMTWVEVLQAARFCEIVRGLPIARESSTGVPGGLETEPGILGRPRGTGRALTGPGGSQGRAE